MNLCRFDRGGANPSNWFREAILADAASMTCVRGGKRSAEGELEDDKREGRGRVGFGKTRCPEIGSSCTVCRTTRLPPLIHCAPGSGREVVDCDVVLVDTSSGTPPGC